MNELKGATIMCVCRQFEGNHNYSKVRSASISCDSRIGSRNMTGITTPVPTRCRGRWRGPGWGSRTQWQCPRDQAGLGFIVVCAHRAWAHEGPRRGINSRHRIADMTGRASAGAIVVHSGFQRQVFQRWGRWRTRRARRRIMVVLLAATIITIGRCITGDVEWDVTRCGCLVIGRLLRLRWTS
jgi:hypothetical protein